MLWREFNTHLLCTFTKVKTPIEKATARVTRCYSEALSTERDQSYNR